MNAMDEANSASTCLEAMSTYEQTMHLITAACNCSGCRVNVQEEYTSLDQNQPFCQPVLVEVVTQLVQILSNVSMAAPILPTRAGLEMLYWQRFTDKRRSKEWNHIHKGLLDYRHHKPLMSAKGLFCGRNESDWLTSPHAAIASGEVCIYMDTLVNISANPEQCYLVHVIPGRIEWEHSIYERVTDMPRDNKNELCSKAYEAISGSTITSSMCSNLKDSTSQDLNCELFVEADGVSLYKNVRTAYRISTANGRFLIGPSIISTDIAAALSLKDCKGRKCATIPPFDVSLVQGEGLMIDRGSSLTPTLPIIRVLPKELAAQWVAVSQDFLYTAEEDPDSIQLGREIVNFLQGNQCLCCLLTGALRGSRHLKDKTGVCIVTSSGVSGEVYRGCRD